MNDRQNWKNKLNSVLLLKKPVYSWLALAVLLVVTFFVFYNTLSNDFIYNWDDNINVTNNSHIRDFSWSGMKKLFDPHTAINEPRLTLLTYAIEYHLFTLNPAPYHLHNLILHLLNIILVFLFAAQILKKKNLAFLVALLFALHPMHVESVAWITGRKDLLFSFFYLLSMLFYILYIRKKENPLLFILAAGLGFLSVLSKIQALSLPLAWIALDLYFRRDLKPLLMAEKLFLFMLLFWNLFYPVQFVLFALIFMLIRYQKDLLKLDFIIKAGSMLEKKLAFRGYLLWSFFIGLISFFIFKKINQHTISGFDLRAAFLSVTESVLLVFSYLFCLVKNERIRFKVMQNRTAGLAILFVVLFAAVLFIFPYMKFWTADFRPEFSFIDRLCMAAYSLCYYLLRFVYPFGTSPIQPYPDASVRLPWIFYFSTAAVFLILVILTFLVWKKKVKISRESLFGIAFFLLNIALVLHLVSIEGRVIAADRYAYLAYLGLFISMIFFFDRYWEKIKQPFRNMLQPFVIILSLVFAIYSNHRNKIWSNGIKLFTEVIAHNPGYELAYSNRGTLYMNMGRQYFAEATADFMRAIRLKPDFDVPLYNLALIQYNLQNYDEAFKYADKTIKTNPRFIDAWLLRGFTKNKKGDFSGAISDYNDVILHAPTNIHAFYNRGNAKKNMGDYKGALADYNHVIEMDSTYASAFNGIGVVYFFMEDDKRSIEFYDRAIAKLVNRGEGGEFYYNRALSEFRLDMHDQACDDLSISDNLGYAAAKDLIREKCR